MATHAYSTSEAKSGATVSPAGAPFDTCRRSTLSQLFGAWEINRRRFRAAALVDESVENFVRATDQAIEMMEGAGRAMAAVPAASVSEVLLKLMVVDAVMEDGRSRDLWEQRLLQSSMTDLHRLADQRETKVDELDDTADPVASILPPDTTEEEPVLQEPVAAPKGSKRKLNGVTSSAIKEAIKNLSLGQSVKLPCSKGAGYQRAYQVHLETGAQFMVARAGSGCRVKRIDEPPSHIGFRPKRHNVI